MPSPKARTPARSHTATSGDSNYNAIPVASVGSNITDNDNAGITVNPTAGLITTESGGSANFTVVLNTQPSGSVTNPSVVGQTFTVNVSVSAQTLSPLGTVTISDGSASCGPVTVTAGTAPASSASCELVGSTAGASTLTATYMPTSAAFAPSSDTATHQVDAAATTITVSGPAQSPINQPTSSSFALSVLAPGGGTPSGVVTLSTDGSSCDVTVPTATPGCELSLSTLGLATISATTATIWPRHPAEPTMRRPPCLRWSICS